MSDEGIELSGLAGVLARGTAAIGRLAEDGRGRLETVGQSVADEARSLAPVGSGDEDTPGVLAAGISSVRDGDDVLVQSLAPYSAHVEYGTSKMAAEPFMRPALAKAHV